MTEVTAIDRPPRRGFRVGLKLYLWLCAVAVVLLAWQAWRLFETRVVVTRDAPLDVGEVAWHQDGEVFRRTKVAQYVRDPVAGFRPAASTVMEFRMGPLDGARQPVRLRVNNWGLVREDDLEGEIAAPRVLMLGDSHLMGVVDNERNAAHLLETELRRSPPHAGATVLNAASGYYSLYQYVLRARTLLDALQPTVVVVQVFAGNDFLELEDVTRPHLDDRGQECPTATDPPVERTSERLAWLGMEGNPLFWQGMNQAAYLVREPDRRPVLEAKARRAVELMEALVEQHESKLLWLVLPSFDQVFPERVAALGEAAARCVQAPREDSLHAWFVAFLRTRAHPAVDLLPAFRRADDPELYALDYHVWEPAHRLIAETLALPLRELLEDS